MHPKPSSEDRTWFEEEKSRFFRSDFDWFWRKNPLQIMSVFQNSALDAWILMIQRPKSLKITRENDWAYFQVGLWPLRPGKRPLGIFWDSTIPNFAHKSAKKCPIFKFLDNFPHYSSSPTFSVYLLWPLGGVISTFWLILIRGTLGPSGEKTATCPRLERASKVGIFFKLSFEVLQVKIFRGYLCQSPKMWFLHF